MSISPKTRKILWAKSGNKCAICQCKLVETDEINEVHTVVGEECHIRSTRPLGPRFDPDFPKDSIDSPENLILLCPTHHTIIDDNIKEYTIEKLVKIKRSHEVMIEAIPDEEEFAPVKVTRNKANIPNFLFRIINGEDLAKIIAQTYSRSHSHDELKTLEEVEVIGSFFQDVEELADFWDDLETIEIIRQKYWISQRIKEVEELGFYVFGAREIMYISGGVRPNKDEWPAYHLRIIRNTNKEIIRI